MDFFGKLIWDIGEILEFALHVDENQNCKLIIEEAMAMQLAMSDDDQYLVAALFIAEIPPGAFRIEVLEKALNANSPTPENGSFSYSKRYNALVLEKFYDKNSLTDAKKLASQLEAMAELGMQWHQAIHSGNLQQLNTHA